MTCINDESTSLLEEGISEARSVLAEHDKYLRGNETRTRALVIDRVLCALSWDITNSELVLLEQRAPDGSKIDYVLLSSVTAPQPTSSNRKYRPLAVVEAKAAGTGLKGGDRRQASGYATEIGAPYAVLTNGRRWEAWSMSGPAERTERSENIIVEVHLETGQLAALASRLGQLHREMLGQHD